MSERIFGEIPGVATGQVFASRRELAAAGVHRPLQAGICGSRFDGAESIVLSGGYADDSDLGDVVIYTGHGGRDQVTGRQVQNQTFTAPGNGGLVVNEMEGLPVRVIRGAGGDPAHSPASGYRYDGLYRVASHWMHVGRDGFLVCQFELRRIADDPPIIEEDSSHRPVRREEAVVQRLVRSTVVAQQVKQMYSHACQICGGVIETRAGRYAEGAHVRPLGRPHDGPDVIGNILCLCPNDHVRFDQGHWVISDDESVVRGDTGAVLGPLRVDGRHALRRDCLEYHRALHAV
jgi:putative restriction endonuclease